MGLRALVSYHNYWETEARGPKVQGLPGNILDKFHETGQPLGHVARVAVEGEKTEDVF